MIKDLMPVASTGKSDSHKIQADDALPRRFAMRARHNGAASFELQRVEGYEPFVGAETVERILAKAEKLGDLHIVNINSTHYGGGLAEIRPPPLTLLMNSAPTSPLTLLCPKRTPPF